MKQVNSGDVQLHILRMLEPGVVSFTPKIRGRHSASIPELAILTKKSITLVEHAVGALLGKNLITPTVLGEGVFDAAGFVRYKLVVK